MKHEKNRKRKEGWKRYKELMRPFAPLEGICCRFLGSNLKNRFNYAFWRALKHFEELEAAVVAEVLRGELVVVRLADLLKEPIEIFPTVFF